MLIGENKYGLVCGKIAAALIFELHFELKKFSRTLSEKTAAKICFLTYNSNTGRRGRKMIMMNRLMELSLLQLRI